MITSYSFHYLYSDHHIYIYIYSDFIARIYNDHYIANAEYPLIPNRAQNLNFFLMNFSNFLHQIIDYLVKKTLTLK